MQLNSTPPDEALSLAAIARRCRVDGKPVSPASVWRWARRGKDGIRLRVWKRGRTLVTTAAEFERFEQAVAEADARRWAEHVGEPLESPHPRHQQIEARAAALGV